MHSGVEVESEGLEPAKLLKGSEEPRQIVAIAAGFQELKAGNLLEEGNHVVGGRVARLCEDLDFDEAVGRGEEIADGSAPW